MASRAGQVLYAPNIVEMRITVVKKTCRCILKTSCEKKKLLDYLYGRKGLEAAALVRASNGDSWLSRKGRKDLESELGA